MTDSRGRDESVGLADAIAQVRSELAAAHLAGGSEQLKFRLGEVTLEFAVEVAREGGAEASVKVWVVNVGAKGSVSSSEANTVTVKMTPQVLGQGGQWVDAFVGDTVAGRPAVGRPGR